MKNFYAILIVLILIGAGKFATAQNQMEWGNNSRGSISYLLDSIITWEFDSATLHYDKPLYAQRYSYDANNNKTIFLEQLYTNNNWVNSFRDTFIYANQNVLAYFLDEGWTGTAWDTTYIIYYFYNQLGEQDSSITLSDQNGAFGPYVSYSNTFDVNGNEISSYGWAYNSGWLNSSLDSFAYNGEDKIISNKQFGWNNGDNNFQNADWYTYYYNGNGNNTIEWIQKWNFTAWDTVGQLANTFDVNNNEITSIRYNVNIPDFNIAGPNDSSQYYYETATGINTISNTESVRVFPNPACSFVNILFADITSRPFSITLYDITGQALLSEPVSGNPMQINISNLAAGVYEVLVTDDEGDRTVRQVVIR